MFESRVGNRKNIYRRTVRPLIHLYRTLIDPAPKIIILLYHRVLPYIKFNPFNTVISLETFIKQIDILARKYPIISLNDMINQCRRGQQKDKIQIVLTFDDGYQDNCEIVFPILNKKGLPATFFLVTNYINSNKPLWELELFNILNNVRTIEEVKIEERIINRKLKESGLSFAFRVFEKMKSVDPKTREKIIDFLRELIETKSQTYNQHDSIMTWEQVRRIAQGGMEIGVHGMTHSSLSRIPFREATQEIEKSKEIIEKNLKKSCIHFAFPFGSQKDYNQDLVDYVKDVGFQACLLNIQGYNHIKKDAFCFKRIIMGEFTSVDYLLD